MKETTLDRLSKSALDCQEQFRKTIGNLSAVHRLIGQLEGKIEILLLDLDEQSNYCRGYELIQVSRLEGMLYNMKQELEKVAMSAMSSELEDESTAITESDNSANKINPISEEE